MTDTLLKFTAMEILVKNLGVVDTERFITLILKEPFDYTAWRQANLHSDIDVKTLNQQATAYWDATYPSVQQ